MSVAQVWGVIAIYNMQYDYKYTSVRLPETRARRMMKSAFSITARYTIKQSVEEMLQALHCDQHVICDEAIIHLEIQLECVNYINFAADGSHKGIYGYIDGSSGTVTLGIWTRICSCSDPSINTMITGDEYDFNGTRILPIKENLPHGSLLSAINARIFYAKCFSHTQFKMLIAAG